ncbi:MAG: FAD binding domain-containing protein [Actinomycetota bacterium]|nr:FAD binding domain-containing protein [Actinomycetota bacterium]
MKPPAFRYHRPRSLDESVRLLADLGEDAKVLGGGQSLLPIMNMRLAEPTDLVDVTAIKELRGATVVDGAVRYGATTTHGMLEDQLVPDAAGGLLHRAATGIGYRAVRNRGTVAGSLAHSDSSAEWPTVMSALDAIVEATSVRGTRQIPVRDLLQGFFTTMLDHDEVISAVRVARLPEDRWWGLHKSARKAGEFAESLAVALVDVAADGRITQAELWLGAARDVPVQLRDVAALVQDAQPQEITVADLLPAVATDIGRSLDDPDPHARHALQLHAVTVQRALKSARKARSDA